MQDPQDSGSRLGPPGPPAIKEEDKELPPGAEYLSSRCVLFTYFQGDISAVVDEHFSRALSQTTVYPGSGVSKSGRGVCPSFTSKLQSRLILWNLAYISQQSVLLSAWLHFSLMQKK